MTFAEFRGSPRRSLLARPSGPARLRGLFLAGLMAVAACLSTAAPGQADGATRAILVIGNDNGGVVRKRAEEIRVIASRGTRVEIRGSYCNSTCTMYLGAPDVCVSARTTFGFHGPSHHGASLSPRDYEYWSRVIAAHYPRVLRDWYMTKGRKTINDYYQISGAELIRLGVPQCGDTPGAKS